MAERNGKTSTDYQHPYRPLPVRAFNFVAGSGGNTRLSSPLNIQNLLNRAKQKAGHFDFGDDDHLPALKVLVRSINEEARLSPIGRLIQKSRLTSALVHRLRIQSLLKKHPEIHDIDLGTIIMITGLQRTGTTVLHRLLHSHPDIRGVTGMEAMEPVPTGNANTGKAAIQPLRAILAQKVISYLAPQFITVHPIDYNEPEEDVLLLDLCFMSQAPEATMHVPSYSCWLEGQNHTQAYGYLRTVLKVLYWQRPGRYWVLKTPQHMEFLDVFLKVFPEALVVQTHRDPRKALPSFCSMVAHGRAIFSDHVDPREIARHWCRKTRRMVELTMQVRARANAARFIDVSYYDLMENPVAQLQRIYRRADIKFGTEIVQTAENYMNAHPKNRFGKHVYRLDDFGLNEKIIEDNFSIYREKYAIPLE